MTARSIGGVIYKLFNNRRHFQFRRWLFVRRSEPSASKSGREMVFDEIGNGLSMGLSEIVIAAANNMKIGVGQEGQ